jgi:hypothetical protein
MGRIAHICSRVKRICEWCWKWVGVGDRRGVMALARSPLRGKLT